jgi:hypothetical protein
MVQRLFSLEKGSSFIAVIWLAMEYIFRKMKLEIMRQDSRL